MSCHFCESKIKLLPSFTGEQYHTYQVSIAGHPRCAYPFDDPNKTHPHVPMVRGLYCDFCRRCPLSPVHDVSKQTALHPLLDGMAPEDEEYACDLLGQDLLVERFSDRYMTVGSWELGMNGTGIWLVDKDNPKVKKYRRFPRYHNKLPPRSWERE